MEQVVMIMDNATNGRYCIANKYAGLNINDVEDDVLIKSCIKFLDTFKLDILLDESEDLAEKNTLRDKNGVAYLSDD